MNIISRILPKIVNGIALFYATWMLLVLSAFFFARDFHEQRSAWVYGEEAPLMGSPVLDAVVGVVPALLVLVMAVLLVGKEFVLDSRRSRLWMNVGVAVLATALVAWLIQALIVLPG